MDCRERGSLERGEYLTQHFLQRGTVRVNQEEELDKNNAKKKNLNDRNAGTKGKRRNKA